MWSNAVVPGLENEEQVTGFSDSEAGMELDDVEPESEEVPAFTPPLSVPASRVPAQRTGLQVPRDGEELAPLRVRVITWNINHLKGDDDAPDIYDEPEEMPRNPEEGGEGSKAASAMEVETQRPEGTGLVASPVRKHSTGHMSPARHRN